MKITVIYNSHIIIYQIIPHLRCPILHTFDLLTPAGVPCERGVLSVSEIWVVWPACHDCPTIDKRDPVQYGKGLQEVNKIIMLSLAHWYRRTYTPFVKLFGLENLIELWIPPKFKKNYWAFELLKTLWVAECSMGCWMPIVTPTPPSYAHTSHCWALQHCSCVCLAG